MSFCYIIIKNTELSLAESGSCDRQQKHMFPRYLFKYNNVGSNYWPREHDTNHGTIYHT